MKKINLSGEQNADYFGYKKILEQEGFKLGKGLKVPLEKEVGGKAVENHFHYKDTGFPIGFFRVLLNKYFSRPVRQMSLRRHRILLRDILEQMTGQKHKNYWPNGKKAAFCLRIDVDFPLRYFYLRKKILQALVDFKKDLDAMEIKASLFLNLDYLSEAKVVKKVFADHDIQLHGCSKRVPHRRYGYDLHRISYRELYQMLSWGKKMTGASIFAPPCEHVDSRVLEICENLGFEAVSAGHLGKDDIPYKCYLGREFNLLNIPTSSVELLEKVPLSYYLREFDSVVQDESLFCIYFHPIMLLKYKEKILALLKQVKQIEKEKKVWITTQKELVEWWKERGY